VEEREVIEKLNASLNLICFALILFGGVLSFHQPEIGKLIITASFGALGGAAVRGALNQNE
jgi:hypothetical protein